MKSSLPEDSEANAQIECIYGRRLAKITLCRHFTDLLPETQRQNLVHELTHPITEPMRDVVYQDLKRALADQAFGIITSMFDREMERAVDHLATFYAEHLPLPKL